MRVARVVAVLTLGALTAVVLAAGGRAVRTDGSETEAPVTTSGNSAPAGSDRVTTQVTTTRVTTTQATTTQVVSTTPVSTTVIVSATASEVAVGGLEAWGRFGVSGDLTEIEPWFHPDGPQYARFRRETDGSVADPVGGPAYSVTFEPEDSTGSGDEVRMRGRVVFVRTGEPSQAFEWVIVLRREGGRWWVWTVEEAEAQSPDESASRSPSSMRTP